MEEVEDAKASGKWRVKTPALNQLAIFLVIVVAGYFSPWGQEFYPVFPAGFFRNGIEQLFFTIALMFGIIILIFFVILSIDRYVQRRSIRSGK